MGGPRSSSRPSLAVIWSPMHLQQLGEGGVTGQPITLHHLGRLLVDEVGYLSPGFVAEHSPGLWFTCECSSECDGSDE